MWQLSQNLPARHASLNLVKQKISTQNGANTIMAEDIATEIGLIGSGSSDQTLSPAAIVGLLLEIQSSLLETPEHAHLSDAAEDLLLGLVRSIKNAEALNAAAANRPGQPAVPASGKTGRPKLRIVKGA